MQNFHIQFNPSHRGDLVKSYQLGFNYLKKSKMAACASYDDLCVKLKSIQSLRNIDTALCWDQQVMMPSEAVQSRAEQRQFVAKMIHKQETDETLGALLKELSSQQLSFEQQATVRIAFRDYKIATACSEELVSQISVQKALAISAWEKAKASSNWKLFSEHLKTLIDLYKQYARSIDPSKDPYDVLLDQYEIGNNRSSMDKIFENLKKKLIPIAKQLRSAQNPDTSWLNIKYNVEKQRELNQELAEAVGVDMGQSRLDESAHPMAYVLDASDVRISTMYSEDSIMVGLLSTIHECGHAMYQQNIKKQLNGLPSGKTMSAGIDEGQALLWENHIGLSSAFSQYIWPKLTQKFPKLGRSGRTWNDFYKAVNVVQDEPYIRIFADEVNYPLHVMLRYEIEKQVFDGELTVDDVPDKWNELMELYFGITPPNDSLGCLQDIHWSDGSFGYFPCYVLGMLYASSIYKRLVQDSPGGFLQASIPDSVAKGQFKVIKDWLAKNIHQHGSLYPTQKELLAQCGATLNEMDYIDYIKTKYSNIYGIRL